MGSDGVNVDLTFNFPIVFNVFAPFVLFSADVRGGSGGFSVTHCVRDLGATGVTRESNYPNIGGWVIAIGW